jgi:hypothetical protein
VATKSTIPILFFEPPRPRRGRSADRRPELATHSRFPRAFAAARAVLVRSEIAAGSPITAPTFYCRNVCSEPVSVLLQSP